MSSMAKSLGVEQPGFKFSKSMQEIAGSSAS